LAAADVLFGLLVAFVSVQTIVALDFGFGGLAWAQVASHDRFKIVALALVAALLVPLAEETIFRGFLQTEVSRKLGAQGGWLLTAAIFALVHFLKIPDELDHQPVHWWSGPGAIGAAFLPILHGWFLSGRGLNLFIIGLILGGIFRRTGTLWFNYGLHGGWIFGLLLAIKLAHPMGASFWTGDDLLGSPLTGIVLAVLGWWLWRFHRRPQPGDGSTVP
jgi:membrane protease YdiL (CAAX protease family)